MQGDRERAVDGCGGDEAEADAQLGARVASGGAIGLAPSLSSWVSGQREEEEMNGGLLSLCSSTFF
jgi:hypothetical protein